MLIKLEKITNKKRVDDSVEKSNARQKHLLKKPSLSESCWGSVASIQVIEIQLHLNG